MAVERTGLGQLAKSLLSGDCYMSTGQGSFRGRENTHWLCNAEVIESIAVANRANNIDKISYLLPCPIDNERLFVS